MRLILLLLALLNLTAPALAETETETRVALVIGNSQYEHETTLRNPENDAREVARALRDVGYDVVVAYDLTRNEMLDAISAFGDRAAEADAALAYYAGHGIEARGVNYLIPTDARLTHAYQLELRAVTLSALVNTAGQARRLSMVVLDACRDNRFRSGMISAGRGDEIGRGLGRPPPRRRGGLVVYAAEPGKIASDGAEGAEHSPFTAAFLQTLEEQPDRDVGLFFRRVADRVYNATDGAQLPALYGALGGDEIPMRGPLTPAEIAQRRFACQTDSGAQGVSFGQKCWPLDTTKIEYSDIPSSVRREITDASPLAGLTGLWWLDLSFTEVSDVTALAGLTGLQRLDLSFTEVSNVTALSGLTGLQWLSLSRTQVSDVTPLSGLTGLQRLDLSFTEVSNVTALSGLTGLEVLDLSYTRVSDVTPLSGLTGLRELDLSGTEVSDVTALSGLTGLQRLSLGNLLGGAPVSDVTALSGLTGLRLLDLSWTPVSDVTALSGLTGLQELSLSNTEVSDVTALSGLTGLQRLFLGNTEVRDVTALSGLTGLYFLQMPDGVRVGGVRNTPENRTAVAEAIREAIRAGRPAANTQR